MQPKYWAIILLATLAVCASAVYYVVQPNQDFGPIVFHHQVKSNKSQSSTSTDVSTSDLKDWKIYTNSQYGFSLQYPESWTVSTTIDSLVLHQIAEEERPDISIEFSKKTLDQLTVDVKNNVDDFLKDSIVESEINFNEVKAKEIEHGTAIGGENIKNILFIYNGQSIWIRYASDWDPDNKIISTFKFILTSTTASADTSGWKSYTNSKDGFSLMFPPDWSKIKVEDDGWSFDLPNVINGQYSWVCGVRLYTETDWSNLINSEGYQPWEKIDEKGGIVYAYSCGQDDEGYVGFETYNQTIAKTGDRSGNGPYKEFKNLVIPTFKFTK